ncbi:hypothetical protein E2C01_078107 [Portunus trituberculatus]|uniref:Uncharacterized protein n=1 Tax=Portunus trituberculatus TaxID=210409 RepID=A0A5B7IRU9_PORTR|nr:hypothetical protein [Portunus trituberculatus]
MYLQTSGLSVPEECAAPPHRSTFRSIFQWPPKIAPAISAAHFVDPRTLLSQVQFSASCYTNF